MTSPAPLSGRLGVQAQSAAANLSTAGDDIRTDSPAARLRRATQQPFEAAGDVSFASSESGLDRLRGYDNPYGRGLAAYEPNTVLFEDYATAKSAVDRSKAAEAAAADQMATVDFTAGYAGGGAVTADGRTQSFIAAAMSAIGKPYVWGGTNLATGVDCSGLIYAAAKAAGIDMPRYRAVDYRTKIGTTITADQARPGDLVTWDNPGDTDHVGIYLGNGQVLQAPQTGDKVKISQVWGTPTYRRVFNDAAFTASPLPTGGTTPLYNGRAYTPAATLRGVLGTVAPWLAAPTPAPQITRTGTGGRTRAI
jgi:cell wall-associated NlpC family hydrolase